MDHAQHDGLVFACEVLVGEGDQVFVHVGQGLAGSSLALPWRVPVVWGGTNVIVARSSTQTVDSSDNCESRIEDCSISAQLLLLSERDLWLRSILGPEGLGCEHPGPSIFTNW